ncbi:hypothetical protein Patl1_12063 [Pistacia atlantica]|uniref:Uncharacterized protein n=1 Tax=Pistacia atlantica TaxID=434234 RepID=A0ACC1A5J8_9ROSI|nr:hypothetical protein Patl1_12063 [Pistacia atlantica]
MSGLSCIHLLMKLSFQHWHLHRVNGTSTSAPGSATPSSVTRSHAPHQAFPLSQQLLHLIPLASSPTSIIPPTAPPLTLPSHELDDEGFATKALQHLLLYLSLLPIQWFGLV